MTVPVRPSEDAASRSPAAGGDFQVIALLLCVQILPSLLRYLGADSSMALGTTATAIILVVMYIVSEAIAVKTGLRRSFNWGPCAFAALCVFLTAPHAAVADAFQTSDVARLLKTLPLLFLLLAGGLGFGRILLAASDASIRRALAVSFAIHCLFIPFSVFGIQPLIIEGGYEKSMFPFTETSHWALAFAPLLLYRCIDSQGAGKSAWLVFGFVVALVLQSLTLLIACMLMAIACRRFLLLAVIGFVAILGAAPFELDYFASRLDPSQADSNLSTLVYVQGWQLFVEAFSRSSGWGVGFQQLGVRGTGVSAADAIYMVASIDNLNLLDGGFVFAKLGAELGVFGIAISALFSVLCVYCLRSVRRGRERTAVEFARCVTICYTIDMFVRGTGYFTGSTLLEIAAAGVLFGNPARAPILSRFRTLRSPAAA